MAKAKSRSRAPKAAAGKSGAAAVKPGAAPKKPGKGIILGVFLLLAAGVAVQGYLLWKKEQRAKVVVNFINQVAPNGRNQDGAFCCARAMGVDHAGNFYVLEEPEVGHKLQKFSPEGKFLGAYRPRPGDTEQAITEGMALAFDAKDNLYVLERASARIKVLSPDLKYQRSIPCPSRNAKHMIANSKDQLVVADGEKSVLMVLSLKGDLLAKLDGGKNRLGGPYKLALGPDDQLWVLDVPRGFGEDPDIKGYTAQGEPIAKWTVKDFPSNPYNYIGYHPSGHLIINDNRGNSLGTGFHFFTPKGKELGTAEMTNNRWVFKNISGFVIDNQRGDIYVNTNFMGRGGDRFQWDPQQQQANKK